MIDESIFTAALEKEPAERAAFLAAVCGTKPELRRLIEELLASHDAAGSFLAEPAVVTGVTEQINDTDPENVTRTVAPPDPDQTVSKSSGAPVSPEESLAFLKPSSRPDSLGRLAHYEALQVLGSGGFGTVLKAFDDRLHRMVAVKMLAPQLAASGTARARFLREGRSAAAVRDEHVVNVFAVSDDAEPIPYLVMELVSGQTLQQKLDKTGPLPAKDVLRIGSQIAKGLAAAHATGLIHRDIKPANILLENGVERVKITDFGLARAADDASLSQSGVVAGTPMYMSPEQARGDSLDHRSDLFSLGSVLYAISAGRPPFRAETTLGVLKRVCEDTPRPVREVNPEIPVWLADVIARLHAKKPEDRFQSAKDVADLLGKYLAEVQQHGTVISHTPAPKPPRWRKRAVIASLVAVPLLTVAAAILYVWSGKDVRPSGVLVIEGGDPTTEFAVESDQVAHHFTGPQERKLPPGWYSVTARKNGRVLDYQTVTLLRDTRTTLTFKLAPPAPAPVAAVIPNNPEIALVGKFEGHEGTIRALRFLPGGKEFVSLGQDYTLRKWDIEKRTAAVTRLDRDGGINDGDFSTDGQLLAYVMPRVGLTRVWDVAKTEAVTAVKDATLYSERVIFSPDGKTILLSGTPGRAMQRNARDGKEIRQFQTREPGVIDIAFSSDGKLVAIAADKEVRIWVTATGAGTTPGYSWSTFPEICRLGMGVEHFAVAFQDGSIQVLDSVQSRIQSSRARGLNGLGDTKTRLSNRVCQVQFLRQDRFLLATFDDGAIRVWDLDGGQLVGEALGPPGGALEAAVSPDGRYLITGGGETRDSNSASPKATNDHSIHLWRLPEGARPEEASKSNAPPLALAPFSAAKAKDLQEAWATHLGVTAEFSNNLKMSFRLIPPGEFTMGTSPEEIEWLVTKSPDLPTAPDWLKEHVRKEGPERRVTIRQAFHLGKHEVTVGQFREFVKATGHKTEAETNGGGNVWNNTTQDWERAPENIWSSPKYSGSESHPVTFVTPKDALAFCEWLGKQDGRTYALPTEEQWEYACRAGTTTRWWFGDDADKKKEHSWTVPHSGGKHYPVGLKLPNPFGLFDMHGNVTELVTTPQNDIFERGGQANEGAWRGRSAWRYPVFETHYRRGFRVVASGPPVKSTAMPPKAVQTPQFGNLGGGPKP